MAKKRKNTVYTLFGKIGDILLIPIVILAFCVSAIILFDRQTDKIPTIFGYSMVKVLSGSMEKSGFYAGDRVFIKQTKTKDLWEGDIIAFYYLEDEVDKDIPLFRLESKDQQITKTKQPPKNRLTLKQVQKKGIYKVYFHHINKVFVDESGVRFYETKGSSNSSSDTYEIREDFVLGKYTNTPLWVRGALDWLSSSMGMVVCVCIPLGILVILQSLALIEQINFMYIEKKLIKGEIYWQDREVQRLFRTGEVELMCKIIYPTKVDKDELDDLFDEIWFIDKKHSKKQKQLEQTAQKSLKILKQKGNKEYLLFWKRNLKYSWDIKKIDEEILNYVT